MRIEKSKVDKVTIFMTIDEAWRNAYQSFEDPAKDLTTFDFLNHMEVIHEALCVKPTSETKVANIFKSGQTMMLINSDAAEAFESQDVYREIIITNHDGFPFTIPHEEINF